MKNSVLCPMMFFFLIALSATGQIKGTDEKISKIEPREVQIGLSKTTSIVFPYAIKSVDKGSEDILVQKAKGVENILLIKAGQPNFTQTNLTVVTADGKLFGYVLNYEEHCPILNIIEERTNESTDVALFSSEKENRKQVQEYAVLALSKKKKQVGLREEKYYVKLQVSGIFIHQDVMYFRLLLGNSSRINYDIDQLRFFIRDQKKSKRTASQEIEVLPLFATSNVKTIADESEVSVVFALPKFTISEKKYFVIQLIEKDGWRNVGLNVRNGDLNHLNVLTSL